MRALVMFNLNIKERLENYRRVLAVSRKPSMEDYKLTAKISAVGMLAVGMVGFVVYLLSVLFIG